jgi:multiple sugar transport system permease protein
VIQAFQKVLYIALFGPQGEPGAPGIEDEVAHGGNAGFDRRHFPEAARQRQREQADSGIKVQSLFARGVFGQYFQNSLVTVISSVLLSLAVAAPAAYALTRLDFKRKKDVAFYILSIRMAPAIAVVIPFFLIGSLLGILDTKFILVLAYFSFNIPFAVWMLKGFMTDIPVEVDEAAMIDGCSRFGAFVRLILPLTANGLAATAILCLIQSWNEFTFALFLSTTSARTLPTIVTQFLTFQGVVWGEMSAAATITTVPVVVFALMVRKHLISGLTFGATKD